MIPVMAELQKKTRILLNFTNESAFTSLQQYSVDKTVERNKHG